MTKKSFEEKLIELEKSIQFLEGIRDNAAHAIISTDTEGLITSFNKKAEEILGYKESELVGKNNPGVFHDLDEVVQRTQEFSEKLGIELTPGFKTFVCHTDLGLENQFEWTYVRKDGSRFPVNLSITTLKNKKGETTGYLGIAQDITEKKKLEEEVNRKNFQLEQAQAISKMGSWSFDLESQKISWSRELYNIFPESIENGPPSFERHMSTVHPDDRGMWLETVEKCIADGQPYFMLFRTFKKEAEGEVVWVEAYGQGQFEEGKVVSMSGTCQDITDKVLREKEMALILENNKIGIWKFNPINNELFWDQSMYELFEIQSKGFSGAYDAWSQCLHPESARQAQNDFEQALLGHGNFESNFKILTKDGKVKHIGARALIDRDNQGEAVFVTGINWDRTKEQQAIEQLEIRARELELAEKAKSDFLANMSHEIRTPLNGMLGMLNILRETIMDDEQQAMLETITESSEMLLTILSDILDLSKIDAGKMTLEKVDFEVNKTLRGLTQLVGAKAFEKSNKIIFDPNREELWLRGDITRIRQILGNFLSNAVKFTENGLIEVGYKLKEGHLSDLKKVCFYVKDSGVGISKEAQERLFQDFSQADSSITRKFGGTGLGLAISARLAQLMKGEVGVESEVGKGAIFFLELPLEVSDGAKKTDKKSEVIQEMGSQFPHKILVAEDNKTNQAVVKLTLKKIGYECDIVENGLEVLEALSKNCDYTIIFMDLQMPKMDGISAAKKIRETYGAKAPPIIALTANAFSSDKIACREAGMSDFLTKPLNKTELSSILLNFHPSVQKKRSA